MANINLVDAAKMADATKKPKKWIKSATKNAHGQFAAKAKAAGETTKEFANEHESDEGKLGKQARLAKTLMGMSHKKNRSKLYGSKE